jgi:hypothetical protein
MVTHPFACSGVRTACNASRDEPSPIVAKATRFCLRTERTKPLMESALGVEARDEAVFEFGWRSCEIVDDRRVVQSEVTRAGLWSDSKMV